MDLVTLREFAEALKVQPKPTPGHVRDLALIAIQLREAGVVLSLDQLADRASFAAWLASAKWLPGREADLADDLAAADDGEAIFMAAARQLVEAIQ